MKPSEPAQELAPTPAEAAGLLRRISRRVVQWITLRDAFLYVWKQLGNSKIAQSELREKLEAGEIGARAQIFEVFDLTAGLLNSDWAEDTTTEPHETFRREIIVPKFWARAEIDYSGRDFARSVGQPYVFKVHGITILRDDVFRLWPTGDPDVDGELAPESRPSSKASAPVQSPQRKPAIAHNELVKFLATAVNIDMTYKQAWAAAKAAFPHLSVPDKARFRPAWKEIAPSQRRATGDNANTLKSKSGK